MIWEFHSHAMERELQCMGIKKHQFLKSFVGILFPQQTLYCILSEMLHLAYMAKQLEEWISIKNCRGLS